MNTFNYFSHYKNQHAEAVHNMAGPRTDWSGWEKACSAWLVEDRGKGWRESSEPTATQRKHQTVEVKWKQRSYSQELRGPELMLRLTQNATMLLDPEGHAGVMRIYIMEGGSVGVSQHKKSFSSFVWVGTKCCEASGHLCSVWSKITSVIPFFFSCSGIYHMCVCIKKLHVCVFIIISTFVWLYIWGWHKWHPLPVSNAGWLISTAQEKKVNSGRKV